MPHRHTDIICCIADSGPEAEGSQGGEGAEEEEVRLPQGVQALRLQPVDGLWEGIGELCRSLPISCDQ